MLETEQVYVGPKVQETFELSPMHMEGKYSFISGATGKMI